VKNILSVHHRLNFLQQKRSVRIVLTIILSLINIGIFAPTLITSYKLHHDRSVLYDLFTGQDQRIVAEQLEETGYVEINGKRFGDERLKGFVIINQDGLVVDPARVTMLVLSNKVPTWIPTWLLQDPDMTWIIFGISLLSCIMSVWIGLFLPLLYCATTAVIGWIFFTWLGVPSFGMAVSGMCLLGFSYHLIIALMRIIFSSPRQVPTLARGVLLEASRTRLSICFLTILLVLLPLIPLMLDPESPLRHRIQTMLSRSLGTTFAVAAFLTVFLACATVAFEIRDRQIWQVLTKPVSRLGYLLGKWVGIMSLNFAILTIAGVSVFLYLQYLRSAPVADGLQGDLDRLAVEEEILTARVEALPVYETLTNEQIAERVEQLIEADPDIRDEESIRVALRQKLRKEVQEQFLAKQRSIPPTVGGGYYSHSYRFEELQHAKKTGTPLTFKYAFHIGAADEHEAHKAGFVYNDDLSTKHVVTYVPTMTHVTMIPAYLIDDNGVLEITIYNLFEPKSDYYGKGTMSFDKGGIELLYRVGDFEPNFFRAIFVLWIKLAFLAALGLATSTFLSFPVACLITLTIFASGTLAPYLSQALQQYVPPSSSAIDFGNIAHLIEWGFENVIKGIAEAIVFVLDGFGASRPTDQLVNGMLVSWASVLKGVVTIGLLWSGLVLAVGTIVLRKRQLAIYSGSG
jgi:hypothetical protein